MKYGQERKEKAELIMAAVDDKVTIAAYQEKELFKAIMKTLAGIERKEEQEKALKELALEESGKKYIY